MTTLTIYPLGSGKAAYIGQIEFDPDAIPSPNTNSNAVAAKGSGPLLDSTQEPNFNWLKWPGTFFGSDSNVKNNTFGSSRDEKASSASGVETIVLLDVSGSMGQNVQRIVRHYLPDTLEQIGFKPTDTIKLITFSNSSKAMELTIEGLRKSNQGTEGATYMSPGIKNVERVINSSPYQKIRLITISDGELHDQSQAVAEAHNLASLIKSKYIVNSTAIRLFTSSYGQPDTRGLSSLLQLDTHGSQSKTKSSSGTGSSDSKFIVDINSNNSAGEIVQTMSELLDDNLSSSSKMVCKNSVVLNTPWSNSMNEMYLVSGQNTFWFTEKPSEEDIRIVLEENGVIRDQKVTIKLGEKLGFDSYNTVLKDKVDYFMKRLRILKVINTAEAQQEVQDIVDYFQQLEKYFTMNDPTTQEILNNTLQSRLAFFRDIVKKKQRSVALTMSELANDDRVSQLNSAQQASYLRSATLSTNAKSLAKRAAKQGLDFNSVAVREVKAMKQHLHELDDIDDSNHYVSFYSRETTLQGIKAVCELDDAGPNREGTLEQVTVMEVLQMLNIVGIPCRGPVGDFPDPKTYHLEELMLGSFVSMADVMIVRESGNQLEDPFHNKAITNVIPFYDDDRIQQFLMKYAPTLLEYVASVGMRNMVMEVPHTYKYTVVGGLWNMARRLDEEKTEVNIDVLTKLVLTYKTAVDGIFDYVVPLIKEQSAEDKAKNLSFYISNNGTTNMISPLITIMEQFHTGENVERAKLVPDILRALYSFEFYQVIRKFHRSDDDKLAKKKKMLDELLGINFKVYGTKLPEYYETLKNPKHHNKYHINRDALQNLIDRVPWVDKITILPFLILNSFKGKAGKEAIQNMERCSARTIEGVLGLDQEVNLDQFKFYCIVQSFLFDNKADRVEDSDEAKKNNADGIPRMKIEDCVNTERMERMISEYVEKQYRADYQARLAVKEREERNELADELVLMMATTDTMEEFLKLFREGLARNHVSVKIYDTYQLGYQKLREILFDPTFTTVPLRKEKLWVLVMATEYDNMKGEGATVWNRGNPPRVSLLKLEEDFTSLGLKDFWIGIYPLYKAKNLYIYRESDKPNRHTHCNSKVSFWAMGYPTVGQYFAEITEAEREQYMKIHTHCCGIWDGVLVKPQ